MASRKRAGARPKTSKASKKPTRSARTSRPRAKAARPKTAVRPRPAAKKAAPAAPARIPNGIGLFSHHMDYTSHDLDGIKRFYTELFGFKKFDFDSSANYLYVHTGATSSIGFMPPMPGPPEQWRPPREPTLYFLVQDVDRAHRDLSAKGVVFDQPPQDMPWGHRVALLHDPEGRSVCLAQPKKR